MTSYKCRHKNDLTNCIPCIEFIQNIMIHRGCSAENAIAMSKVLDAKLTNPPNRFGEWMQCTVDRPCGFTDCPIINLNRRPTHFQCVAKPRNPNHE